MRTFCARQAFLFVLSAPFALLASSADPKLFDRFVSTFQTPTTSVYATFNSHNEKMVHTRRGIFALWLGDYVGQQHVLAQSSRGTWSLMRSTDNAQSFREVFSDTYISNAPPALAVDDRDRIFVMAVDFKVFSGNNIKIHFYRFDYDATKDRYAQGAHTSFSAPFGETTKIAAAYDNARNQVLFFRHGRMYRLDSNGRLLSNVVLLDGGAKANPQYPSALFSDRGDLYYAWTSVSNGAVTKEGGSANFYDAHFMISSNGGANWKNFDKGIALPLHADSGFAPRVVFAPDIAPANNNWLANMHLHSNKLHFFYRTVRPNDSYQHYVRYDLAGADRGKVSRHLKDVVAGETIAFSSSASGFFVSSRADLYLVGITADNSIGVLVSHDNGDSWHDFAKSGPESADFRIYALTGAAESFDGQFLYGMYSLIDKSSEERGHHLIKTFRVNLQ